MSLILFLLVCVIVHTTQSTIICTSGDCNIDCSLDNCDTVICTDTASSCNIKCSEENCKQSKFYLSASNSNMVHCTETNSCRQISIQCGISASNQDRQASILPFDYKYEDFDGNIDECIIILPNNLHFNLAKIECHDNVDTCQWTDDITNIDNTVDFKCIGNECITASNSTSNPTRTPSKLSHDEEIFTAEADENGNQSLFHLNTISILISISVGICCGLMGICCCLAICRNYHLRMVQLNNLKVQQKQHKGYQSPISLNKSHKSRNRSKSGSFPSIKHSKIRNNPKIKIKAKNIQPNVEASPSPSPSSNNESDTIQIKVINPILLKPPSSRISSRISQLSTSAASATEQTEQSTVDLDADHTMDSTISKLSPSPQSSSKVTIPGANNGNVSNKSLHRPHITIHSIASLGGIPSVPKSLTTTTYTSPTLEIVKDTEDKLLHERMINAVKSFNQMMVIENQDDDTMSDDDQQHNIDITPSGSQESF